MDFVLYNGGWFHARHESICFHDAEDIIRRFCLSALRLIEWINSRDI